MRIPILVIVSLLIVGLCVSMITGLRTWRDLVMHGRSGRNGFRWVMLTGDLIDEILRFLQHVCLILVLMPSIYMTPSQSWSWRSWLFLTVIVCIVLTSVNRWNTTRSLIHSLRDTHPEPHP